MITSKSRYLAGNPIVVGLFVAANTGLVYKIWNGGVIFQGAITTGTTEIQVDITTLFEDLKNEVSFRYYEIELLNATGTTRIDLKGFTVYGGGISKALLRDLAKNNTDIFAYKLKNAYENFWLTTRSNTRTIPIPENELEILYFYETGLLFDIKCEGVVLQHWDFTVAPENIGGIDFNALRNQHLAATGRLINEFQICSPSGSVSCNILITRAGSRSDFMLKFRNSWGAFEHIGIMGDIEYLPTAAEANKIAVYDTVISDFVTHTQRKEMTHFYKAMLGYKNRDERLFILDMLLSQEVILMCNGMEYEVSVTADSSTFDSTKPDPLAISVTLELSDKDTNYSPIDQSIQNQQFKIFSRKFTNTFA